MDRIKTGRFLKELRREKKLTQKEFGNKHHLSVSSISRYERGICLNEKTCEQLAKYYGVSFEEIINGKKMDLSMPTINEQIDSINSSLYQTTDNCIIDEGVGYDKTLFSVLVSSETLRISMRKHKKDYCAANGMTGPEKLINAVNLLCHVFVANGIHGTIYFIDPNVETKHNILESSNRLEIKIHTKNYLWGKKITLAYDLIGEIEQVWFRYRNKYEPCFTYITNDLDTEAYFCPKMVF